MTKVSTGKKPGPDNGVPAGKQVVTIEGNVDPNAMLATKPFEGKRVSPAPKKQRAGVVAIVAQGFSMTDYFTDFIRQGHSKVFANEVWGVNTVPLLTPCDRAFIMDNPTATLASNPDSRQVMMLRDWAHRGAGGVPVYTSRHDPKMPTSIEYPLAEVVAAVGTMWFNNTVPYMVAYANMIGIKKLYLYGCDYYHRGFAGAVDGAQGAFVWEAGASCLTHHLDLFRAAGGEIAIAKNSILMDTGAPTAGQFYGYVEQPKFRMTKDGQPQHYFESEEAAAVAARAAAVESTTTVKPSRAPKPRKTTKSAADVMAQAIGDVPHISHVMSAGRVKTNGATPPEGVDAST